MGQRVHWVCCLALIAGAVIASPVRSTDEEGVRACRVEQLVARLAKQTGRELRVHRDIAGEIALVVAPKAKPADVMTALARALDGEWEVVGKAVTLKRRPYLGREQLVADRKDRLVFWKGVIEQYRRDLDIPLDSTSVDEFVRRPLSGPNRWSIDRILSYQRALSPFDRFVGRLLLDAGAERLADRSSSFYIGERGSSSVLALGPVFRTRCDQLLLDSAAREGFGERLRGFDGMGLAVRNLAELSMPGALLIQVPPPGPDDCYVQLIQRTVVPSLQREGQPEHWSRTLGAGIALPRAWPFAEEDVLTLPNVLFRPSREAAAHLAAGNLGGAWMATTPPDYWEPERRDPLAFAVSELLVALARAKGRPTVVVLPDEMLGLMPRETEYSLLRAHFVNDLIRFEDRDGWLIGRPKSPLATALSRLDRAALGEFLRGSRRDLGLPFADLATLAAKCGSDVMPPMLHWLLVSLGRQPRDEAPEYVATRFWGLLPPFARRAILAGGSVPVNSLSPALQALLERHVVHTFAWNTGLGDRAIRSDLPPLAVFVDGIPVNAALEGRRTDENRVLYCDVLEQRTVPWASHPTAVRGATSHSPPSWTGGAAPPVLVAKAFLPVTRTTVEFALVLGTDRYRFLTWGEAVAKGTVPVPYEELPKSLRPPPVPRER